MKGTTSQAWRLGAFLAVVAGLVIASFVLPVREWLAGFIDLSRNWGIWGLVALAAAFVPACLLFLPGTPLSLAIGFLYGLVPGVIAVSLGSTAGASAAFWAGRTFARGWVAERVQASSRFAQLDEAVADRGFLIVLLTRLSPAFPFNLLNYAYGLTRVRFRDYLLASWLGMLPGTAMYVYVGTTLASLSEVWTGQRTRTPTEWALLAVGLVATVAVTIVLTSVARRALDKAPLRGPAPG
jgi:uncharacterized membrane protein YdjX (TVP38/TMEM64 family)